MRDAEVDPAASAPRGVKRQARLQALIIRLATERLTRGLELGEPAISATLLVAAIAEQQAGVMTGRFLKFKNGIANFTIGRFVAHLHGGKTPEPRKPVTRPLQQERIERIARLRQHAPAQDAFLRMLVAL